MNPRGQKQRGGVVCGAGPMSWHGRPAQPVAGEGGHAPIDGSREEEGKSGARRGDAFMGEEKKEWIWSFLER